MKTKAGFELRNICGENIVIASGIENIDFNKMISLNESAAYLWKKLEGKPFDATDMVRLLTTEYEVGETTARRDAEKVIGEWLECGIIEQ